MLRRLFALVVLLAIGVAGLYLWRLRSAGGPTLSASARDFGSDARDLGAQAREKLGAVGQEIEDAKVTASVKTALSLNRSLHPYAIEVKSDKGVVTLRGRVDGDALHDKAEALASGVPDVVRVLNQIQTTPGLGTGAGPGAHPGREPRRAHSSDAGAARALLEPRPQRLGHQGRREPSRGHALRGSGDAGARRPGPRDRSRYGLGDERGRPHPPAEPVRCGSAQRASPRGGERRWRGGRAARLALQFEPRRVRSPGARGRRPAGPAGPVGHARGKGSGRSAWPAKQPAGPWRTSSRCVPARNERPPVRGLALGFRTVAEVGGSGPSLRTRSPSGDLAGRQGGSVCPGM